VNFFGQGLCSNRKVMRNLWIAVAAKEGIFQTPGNRRPAGMGGAQGSIQQSSITFFSIKAVYNKRLRGLTDGLSTAAAKGCSLGFLLPSGQCYVCSREDWRSTH
jgi:hypothetical protein